MATSLGTAAYKLVLDARDFQSSAVMSGKSMREVQQVMRQTTTPAEKMAKSYDAVTEAYKKGQIPLKNYQRYLDQFNASAKRNTQAVQDMVSQYGRGIPVIGKYVSMVGTIHPAVIAATAATAGLVSAFKAGQFYFRQIGEQFEQIDALAKRSKATGFDPTSLVGIERGAALVAGMDEATTEKSLAMFVRRLGEVKMGSGEAKRALDLLGLSADELTKLTPVEALQKISDRFQRIETTSEKAATAQFLFGRAGAQLVPLLNEGGDAMARFVQEAEEMRLGFTLEDAEAVELYNDTVADLQRQWQGLWRTVAIEAAPEMAKAVQTFNEALKDPDVQTALNDTLTILQAIAGTFPILAQNAVGFTKGMAATSGFLTPFKGILAQAKEANAASEQMDAFEKQMLDMFNPLKKPGETPATSGPPEDIDDLVPSPTPDWVERWNRAEDALKGTSQALDNMADAQAEYNRQVRDEQEINSAQSMWDKQLKEEADKLEAAEKEWQAMEERMRQRQMAERQRILDSGEVAGVGAGSQQAIRERRMMEIQDAQRERMLRDDRLAEDDAKDEKGLTRKQGETMLEYLQRMADNTAVFAERSPPVKIAEPI